jgi:hypothetical protein
MIGILASMWGVACPEITLDRTLSAPSVTLATPPASPVPNGPLGMRSQLLWLGFYITGAKTYFCDGHHIARPMAGLLSDRVNGTGGIPQP